MGIKLELPNFLSKENKGETPKPEVAVKDKYNFGKYGEKPYIPELDRRKENEFVENLEMSYNPNYKTFVRSMIDDIIGLHKPVSGYILKLLFDEYQRGVTTSDKYTIFFSSYVEGKNGGKHCNIANNNLYLLFVNTWGDIVPRRLIKESDLVSPVLQSLSVNIDIEPSDEVYAKQIAIRIHNKVPNDDWRDEMDGRLHLWDKPIHLKYLLLAKDILSWKTTREEA